MEVEIPRASRWNRRRASESSKNCLDESHTAMERPGDSSRARYTTPSERYGTEPLQALVSPDSKPSAKISGGVSVTVSVKGI